MLTFVSPTLMNRSLPSMDQALDTLSLSHRLCNSVKFCRVRSSAMRYLVIPNSATSAAEGFGMASFLFLSTTFLMCFEIKRRIIGDKAQDYRFRLCGLRWGVSCTSPHLKFVPIFKEHCTMPAQSRCHPLPLPGLILVWWFYQMIFSSQPYPCQVSFPYPKILKFWRIKRQSLIKYFNFWYIFELFQPQNPDLINAKQILVKRMMKYRFVAILSKIVIFWG